MNKTEQIALRWLTEHTGYSADDVLVSHNISPDFVLPDGRGFEVKQLHSQWGFTLYPRQWADLAKRRRCWYLLFNSGTTPVAIIPTESIPLGSTRWGFFRIHLYKQAEWSRPQSTLEMCFPTAASPLFRRHLVKPKTRRSRSTSTRQAVDAQLRRALSARAKGWL